MSACVTTTRNWSARVNTVANVSRVRLSHLVRHRSNITVTLDECHGFFYQRQHSCLYTGLLWIHRPPLDSLPIGLIKRKGSMAWPHHVMLCFMRFLFDARDLAVLERKGRRDDCAGHHWRCWRQASASPMTTRAVTLRTCRFLSTFSITTVIWHCRKPLGMWSGFQMNAALSLIKTLRQDENDCGEWISNFTSHFIMDVIMYPCWD